MSAPSYLYKQGGRYYFRRRIPMFSTVMSPILVSLGAKSENIALRYSITVTIEFETLLETFTFAIDALPENLLHKYMQVMLRRCVEGLERNNRMTWVTGRKTLYSKGDHAHLRAALEVLIETGPYQFYPVDKIDPNWSPNELQRVMELFNKEAQSLKSSQMEQRLIDMFQSATGETIGSLEHKAQIMQIYLQARLASLKCPNSSHSSTSDKFKDFAKNGVPDSRTKQIQTLPLTAPQKASQPKREVSHFGPQRTVVVPLPTGQVLTPNVRIISAQLTIDLLSEQFDTARACIEPLHRSPAKEPYGVDFAGACERSIKIAQAAGEMDDKTADARRSKVKTFCLLANVQTVTEVEQHHFRIFEQRMSDMPSHFLKKATDAKLTWNGIKAVAQDTDDALLGRAPKTFNTYLEQVSAVLKHARANEGSKVEPELNPSLLRKNETTRGRKKRAAFKPDEIKTLFQHPVWSGCRSADRRHEKGNLIHKDGLFYVPLIVALTGGRMEEIAGLNGRLFAGDIDAPRFDVAAFRYLREACDLDWREINPDIFGSMIQSVADPKQRAELGMHYTSVPNIMKVIGALFLDDLDAQIHKGWDKVPALKQVLSRLAGIRVFDPACGSATFWWCPTVSCARGRRRCSGGVITLT